MSEKMESFLCEGMGKYKQAAATLAAFSTEVERCLREILETREDWGSFLPKEGEKLRASSNSLKSPAINVPITGALGADADADADADTIKFAIRVTWDDVEGEYPLYSVWFKGPSDRCVDKMNAFDWNENLKRIGDQICLEPDPTDFNLERDFGGLLDELVRFFAFYTSA